MKKGVESLGKQDRIRKRADYQRCYRRGRRYYSAVATLHVAGSPYDLPRLGITATRKVGGAVVRQRLRRRTREIYRRWPHRARLPAKDIVVHLRREAATASFGELRTALEDLLTRIVDRAERRPR